MLRQMPEPTVAERTALENAPGNDLKNDLGIEQTMGDHEGKPIVPDTTSAPLNFA